MRLTRASALAAAATGLALTVSPSASATVIAEVDFFGELTLPSAPGVLEIESAFGFSDAQDSVSSNSPISEAAATVSSSTPPSVELQGTATAIADSAREPFGVGSTATAGAWVEEDFDIINLTDGDVATSIQLDLDFDIMTDFDCFSCDRMATAFFTVAITDLTDFIFSTVEEISGSFGTTSGSITDEFMLSIPANGVLTVSTSYAVSARARETNLREPEPIGEPMTAALVLGGLGGIGWHARRRKRRGDGLATG